MKYKSNVIAIFKNFWQFLSNCKIFDFFASFVSLSVVFICKTPNFNTLLKSVKSFAIKISFDYENVWVNYRIAILNLLISQLFEIFIPQTKTIFVFYTYTVKKSKTTSIIYFYIYL